MIQRLMKSILPPGTYTEEQIDTAMVKAFLLGVVVGTVGCAFLIVFYYLIVLFIYRHYGLPL